MLLPVGLWQGMAREGGMTAELVLLGAGAGLFLLGNLVLRPYRK